MSSSENKKQKTTDTDARKKALLEKQRLINEELEELEKEEKAEKEAQKREEAGIKINKSLTKLIGQRPPYYEMNIPTNLTKCWKKIREETHYNDVLEKRVIFKHFYDLKTIDDMKKSLNEVFSHEKTTFKISVLFSFCYEKVEHIPKKDKEGKILVSDSGLPVLVQDVEYIIHRAQSNVYFIEAKSIGCKSDFKKNVLDMIHGPVQKPIPENPNNVEDPLLSYCDRQIPGSGKRTIGIFSMVVKIMRGEGFLKIGSKIELPKHILIDKNIISMKESTNNMCFWDCFAYHKSKNRFCVKLSKQLFQKYYGIKPTTDYEGFSLEDDLVRFEAKTNVGINIFQLKEDGNGYDQYRKSDIETDHMNLLLYEGHFCYIKVLAKCDKSQYQCEHCLHSWRDLYNLERHLPTCKDFEQKDVFPKTDTIYEPSRNTIMQLNDEFNTNCDYKFEPLIVYDFEALVVPMQTKIGEKITITNRQQVVSVSLCSNIEGFTEPYCIVSDKPEELFSQMFNRLDAMCSVALTKLNLIYKELSDKIFKITDRNQRNNTLQRLNRYIHQIPVVGFNSGRYDINLDIHHFMKELFKRTTNYKDITSIKAGNTYKMIQGKKMTFLDVCQYLPPNYNLDQYIKAFNPAGLKKSVFPYEFLDSYDKLDFDIHLLERKHFQSSLKNEGINLAQWKEFEVNRDTLGWKTIRDLLVFYNNLDVQPFLEAIVNHKKFFYDQVQVDMFKDALSLPGLAEKIMFKFCFKDFDENFIHQKEIPQCYFKLPSDEKINLKLSAYKSQDVSTNRYNSTEFIQKSEVIEICTSHKIKCHYCWTYCGNEWTLDRLDNDLGHNKGNCVLACLSCNTSRKDSSYKVFYRKKALIRYDKINPLVHLIDDENSDVFYMLKRSIVGGASIVFHRYHEAEKTQIKRPVYDTTSIAWREGDGGKKVQLITGYDANALYLWAIAQDMLCGKLCKTFYDSEIDGDIYSLLSNDFFGLIEVDIYTPEDKKNYFGEFPVLFINMEYDANEIMGDCIKELYKNEKEVQKRMTKKLISTFKATKVVLKSDSLRFMLDKGMVVTKIHSYIRAKKGKIFKGFVDVVSDNRRMGDLNPDHAIIAELWKLAGNSSFGRTIMNTSKFSNTQYVDEKKYIKMFGTPTFKDANQYGDIFEVSSGKRSIHLKIPIQIGCSIFQDSKLKMSQFYYDCVDKYLSREDYQYVQMDTDSAYIAFTDKFEDLIKPQLKEEFLKDRHNWFLRDDTPEHKAYDKRKPGLFKPEFHGKAIVALASKTYYVKGFGDKDKFSAKGIQYKHNTNEIQFEKYLSVLFENTTSVVTNKGMRILNDAQVYGAKSDATQNRAIYGYSIQKVGLSGKYDKRRVLDDKVSTVPLDL